MGNRSGSKETRQMAHEMEAKLNHEFRQRFGGASDEDLLKYAAGYAAQFGIAPEYTDLVGAAVLQKRFGNWDIMLSKLNLVLTPDEERHHIPSLFIRLTNDMEELQKHTQAAMHQNEKAFAEQHQNDTDEELFEYIRLWHKRLKHIPNYYEILGGEYIRKRFKNDWHRVLHLAGLRGSPDCAPKPFRRLIYLDEAKRQMQKYVEDYMSEIAKVIEGKENVCVPPADRAAV